MQLVCSDVATACFDDICELTWSAKGLQPQQGVRFLSAIFLYEGIIHWVLIALFKFPIMWKIESRIRYIVYTYIHTYIHAYILSNCPPPPPPSLSLSLSLCIVGCECC